MTLDDLWIAHVVCLTLAVHQVSMVKLLVHYVIEVLARLHLMMTYFLAKHLEIWLLLHILGSLGVEVERVVQLI